MTRSTSTPNSSPRSVFDLRLESYEAELQKRFGKRLKCFTPVFYTFENALMRAACLDPCWRLAEFILRHSAGNHSVYVVGCSGRLEVRCGRCEALKKDGKPLNQSDIATAMELDRRLVSKRVLKLRRIGLVDSDKHGLYPVPNPELWLESLEPIAPAVNHAADRKKYATLYPDDEKELRSVELKKKEIAAEHRRLTLKMLSRIKSLKSTKDSQFVAPVGDKSSKSRKSSPVPESPQLSANESTKHPDFVAPVGDNLEIEVSQVLSALRKYDPGAERSDAAALCGECRRLSLDKCSCADIAAVINFQAPKAGPRVRNLSRWLSIAVPSKFADDSYISIAKRSQAPAPVAESSNGTHNRLEAEYEESVNSILDQHIAAMSAAEYESLIASHLKTVKQSYPKLPPSEIRSIAERQALQDLRQRAGLVPTWEEFVASRRS